MQPRSLFGEKREALRKFSSNLCVSVSLWLSCISLFFILSACGSGSESGKIFVPESGHVGNWVNPLFVGQNGFHGTVIKVPESGPRGASLFLIHCAACHGNDATGRIGPNIQGVPASFITAAIAVVPLMRGHAILSQGEIAGYLGSLKAGAEPVGFSIEVTSCRECHSSGLDGGIAQISCFSCHDGPEGPVGHPAGWADVRDDPARFHGRYGKDFVEACANCHGVDLNGGIGPRCAECHDGSIAPVLEPFVLRGF